jgi:hypothetical protein
MQIVTGLSDVKVNELRHQGIITICRLCLEDQKLFYTNLKGAEAG